MSTIVIHEGELDVQSVASALASERTTYHTFEARGRRLLYDLNSGVLLTLEAGAYTLLHGLEHGLCTHSLEQSLCHVVPDASARQSLFREVLGLRSAGLFELEPLDVEPAREQAVDKYVEHHPRKMMLLIQTSCNLKCTYCNEVQSQFHQTGGAMPFEVAKQAVDGLIARSGSRKDLEITFFGGEPLLNFSGMQRIVAYAREAVVKAGKSIYFQMTTNGVLLTDKVIDFIIAEGIGVMVSLDGSPEANEIHRVDHRGEGVGAKVTENVKRLIVRQRSAGQRTAKVRATLTRQHSDHGAVAEYFRAQGFDRVNIGASTGRADEKNSWDVPWESTAEDRANIDRRLREYIDALQRGEAPPPGADYSKAVASIHSSLRAPVRTARVGCGVGRNMLAYTGSGKLYPCHRYAGEDEFQIGTVAGGIDKDKMARFYREVLGGYYEHCSHCWARNVCGGQCPWYLSRKSGHVGKPDEASCDSLRDGFENHLWLYSELVRLGLVDNSLKHGITAE